MGCGVEASALCMDKDRAHKMVRDAGFLVPNSVSFSHNQMQKAMIQINSSLSYPLFIKPVRAGSSIGITKIYDSSELVDAAERAFAWDTEVIVEESVPGFEVGCAVMGTENLTVGRVDEIELLGGFFDYNEKYTLQTSKIHMPARISQEAEHMIQKTAVNIYRILGCSGFARVDFFYTPDGIIIFNEVNTVPGMTEHSRFPNMMKEAGLPFPQMLDKLLGLYQI